MGEDVISGLAHLLGRAERALGRRLVDVMIAQGSSVEQWRVLAVLRAGTGRSMREVSEATALPGPALTTVVDRMVATGLVERHVDADDRRRVLVSATPRGRALHGHLDRLVEAESAALAERLGAAELDELTRLLADLLGEVGP